MSDAPGSLQWWGVLWSATAGTAAALAAIAASIAAGAATWSLVYLRKQTTDLSEQLAESRTEREKSEAERLERIEFSMTPVIALEGGSATDLGQGVWRANWTVHLHGEGFAHNLIVNFFVTGVNFPPIAVFKFSRAPGSYPATIDLPVRQMAAAGDLSVRVEALFENAFKQQVSFKQSGFVRITSQELDFTSGAPEYKWPWASLAPRRP